ncbi:hypothetical protein, partial [Mesorhizobium sp. M1329]|uniref:hypothetical protein n=1 Tax=Mesorhizobium sp. M1329 TaxID=2957083 RepID=UPI00333E0AFC
RLLCAFFLALLATAAAAAGPTTISLITVLDEAFVSLISEIDVLHSRLHSLEPAHGMAAHC